VGAETEAQEEEVMDDKIVDLRTWREPKPEGDCQMVEFENGQAVKYFLFTADYEFGGTRWALNIWAKDEENARAKIAAIRDSLKYEGQIYAMVPA
jgi:hypothetical protein